MAPWLGVDEDGLEKIDPALRDLLDPAEIVRTANDLVDVSLAGLDSGLRDEAVTRRVLVRQLTQLPTPTFVAVMALATGNMFPASFSPEILQAALRDLEEQDLLIEGRLRRWARWLQDTDVAPKLFGEHGPLPAERHSVAGWDDALASVRRWMRIRRTPPPAWADSELSAINEAVNEGNLDRVRGELDRLAALLVVTDSTPAWRSDYHFIVGRLRRAEADFERAERAFLDAARIALEGGVQSYAFTCLMAVVGVRFDLGNGEGADEAFQRAMAIADEGWVAVERRADAMEEYASLLRRVGRAPDAVKISRAALSLDVEGRVYGGALGWLDLGRGLVSANQPSAAQDALRQAAELSERSAAPATLRAIILDELAYALGEMGRWAEAERLLDLAIRIQEEHDVPALDLALTKHGMGRVLKEMGQHEAALQYLRAALRLKEESGASGESRAYTMFELAQVCERTGVHGERERLLRDVIALESADNVKPASLARSWRELASCLRSQGKWDESRVAVQCGMKVLQTSDSPAKANERLDILHELAGLQRVAGAVREGIATLREAVRIKREAGADPVSLGVSLYQLGAELREVGDWGEAETILREARELESKGDVPPHSRVLTLRELARGLRDQHRWDEAREILEEALRLESDVPERRVATQHDLAVLLRETGAWTDSRAMLESVLEAKRSTGASPPSVAQTLHELGVGLRQNGELAGANDLLTEAYGMWESSGVWRGASSTLRELARVRVREERWEEAVEMLRRALHLHLQSESPTRLAVETAELLAQTLQRAGRLVEAEESFLAAIRLNGADGDSVTAATLQRQLAELAGSFSDASKYPEVSHTMDVEDNSGSGPGIEGE